VSFVEFYIYIFIFIHFPLSFENAASQRLYVFVGLVTSLIGFVFSAGPFHSCLAVDAFSDLSFNATQRRADFKLSCHRGQLINDALRKAAKVPS
jgi:hypothetical protein